MGRGSATRASPLLRKGIRRAGGQYYDAETGLHYNTFGDYDPTTGRYIQSDPIGLQIVWNKYAYVEGNPVRYDDPTGELPPVVVAALLACAKGVVVGAVVESAIELGTCCYQQCGLKFWRCKPLECTLNPCNIAVSAVASCVASVAFPVKGIPVTWILIKGALKKAGANGVLKQFGKWGCSTG